MTKVGMFAGRSEYLGAGEGLERTTVSNAIRQQFEGFDTIPYQELLDGVFAFLAWKHSNRLVGAMADKPNSQDLKDTTEELALNLDDNAISELSADLIPYGVNPYEEPRHDSPPHLYGEIEPLGLMFGLTVLQNKYLTKRQVQRPSINSSSGTGLPKSGILTLSAVTKLQAGLGIVDQAIDNFDGTNEERAQARAYFTALQALAEAPKPPAELIWQIVNRANSFSGIASLFVALIALFQ